MCPKRAKPQPRKPDQTPAATEYLQTVPSATKWDIFSRDQILAEIDRELWRLVWQKSACQVGVAGETMQPCTLLCEPLRTPCLRDLTVPAISIGVGRSLLSESACAAVSLSTFEASPATNRNCCEPLLSSRADAHLSAFVHPVGVSARPQNFQQKLCNATSERPSDAAMYLTSSATSAPSAASAASQNGAAPLRAALALTLAAAAGVLRRRRHRRRARSQSPAVAAWVAASVEARRAAAMAGVDGVGSDVSEDEDQVEGAAEGSQEVSATGRPRREESIGESVTSDEAEDARIVAIRGGSVYVAEVGEAVEDEADAAGYEGAITPLRVCSSGRGLNVVLRSAGESSSVVTETEESVGVADSQSSASSTSSKPALAGVSALLPWLSSGFLAAFADSAADW